MLSAKFDRHIRIEKKTKSVNDVGTPTSEFTFFKIKKANVNYKGGNTSGGQYGERTSTDATFTIRYDKDINYDCRIIYNDSVYFIQHIEIYGRNVAQIIKTTMYETDE